VPAVPLAAVWYRETATFEPAAATHGYTDAPLATSVLGGDQELPQLALPAYRMRLVLPMSSSQTAARRPLPASATTGNACAVSASLAGETVLWLNVSPPLIERAKFTPPVEVEYTKPTLSLVPSAPPPAREIRLPGGQTHPAWSAGVAPTVEIG